MSTKQAEQPCNNDECGYVAERNRYFTGKYMTARDFQADQTYFLSRHRLHNRLFHGQGIVCGLEVVAHRKEDCQDSWVVVNPGVAIDCCGRELVVEKKIPVKIWDPPGREEGDQAGQKPTQTPSGPGEEAETFLLYLRYVETAIECVPALYVEGQCEPTRQEANRVREETKLLVKRWRKEDDEDDELPCRDDCADSLPGPGGLCLELECLEEQIVPLALIRPKATNGGYTIGEQEIDSDIQNHLPPPPEFLTHIVDYNWTHGVDVFISDIRPDGPMKGRLEVYFDRKLLQSAATGDNTGVGINENTFVVQYSGTPNTLEFLPSTPNSPEIEQTDEYCRAVFTIDPDYLRPAYGGRRERTIINQTIHITLKCDFILDCRGMPVDGENLQGKAKQGKGKRKEKQTGDGRSGGIFESWFRVVPDPPSSRETS